VEREAFCVTHLVTKMQAGELDAAPIYPDLHRFPWSKYRGCVDLVSGGFPCQPFSAAGLRKATEDPRHLWPVIKSGLAVLRPRACFFENVDGIVNAPSPGYHSVLHNVLCDLERLGFRSTAGCFTASEIGAPHKRKRWFILGVCDSDQHSKSDKPFNDEASLLRSHSEPANINDVCDSNSASLQRGRVSIRTQPQHSDFDSPSAEPWPAKPGSEQHGWEAPRTLEPNLGRSADGLSNRLDRLRALGNAVVPGTAARAFSTLWYELNPERN
jgi:DNA (cytosine-5)-methyltransferase 1